MAGRRASKRSFSPFWSPSWTGGYVGASQNRGARRTLRVYASGEREEVMGVPTTGYRRVLNILVPEDGIAWFWCTLRFLQEPGFSAVFLAYGQTGSGKTHTIFGPPGVLTEHDYNESGGYPKTWGFSSKVWKCCQQILNLSLNNVTVPSLCVNKKFSLPAPLHLG